MFQIWIATKSLTRIVSNMDRHKISETLYVRLFLKIFAILEHPYLYHIWSVRCIQCWHISIKNIFVTSFFIRLIKPYKYVFIRNNSTYSGCWVKFLGQKTTKLNWGWKLKTSKWVCMVIGPHNRIRKNKWVKFQKMHSNWFTKSGSKSFPQIDTEKFINCITGWNWPWICPR